MLTVQTKTKTHFIPNPCSISVAKDGISVVTPAGRELFRKGDMEAVSLDEEALQDAKKRIEQFSGDRA